MPSSQFKKQLRIFGTENRLPKDSAGIGNNRFFSPRITEIVVMSSWFVNDNASPVQTEEDIREDQLVALRSRYYALSGGVFTNSNEISQAIEELKTILHNPLLQTPEVDVSTFDHLPFENQLRYMCNTRIAELYAQQANLDAAIEYYVSATHIISTDLALWKNLFRVASQCHLIYYQQMALYKIIDLLFQQTPQSIPTPSNIHYIQLYIQLSWKLFDEERLRSLLTVINQLQIDFSGYPDLHHLLRYLASRFTPSLFGMTVTLPLPSLLSPASLSTAFPSSSSSSSSLALPLQVTSPVEVLHIASSSCWTLVLDKLIECIRNHALLTRFQFIFPDSNPSLSSSSLSSSSSSSITPTPGNLPDHAPPASTFALFSQGSVDSTVMIPTQSESERSTQQGGWVELKSWSRPSVEEYGMRVMACPNKSQLTVENVE